MVKYVYISPVGTSLLQNFARNPKYVSLISKYAGYRISDWYRLSFDDKLNAVPDGYICMVVRGHEIYNALIDYVYSSPAEASAEINGLTGIANSYGHKPSDVEVILYHTKTCNSKLCSNVVEEFLRKSGYMVQSIEVSGLRSVDDFEDGLVEILDKVVRVIVRRRSERIRVYVNATPGFKAETTFLTLASILAGANSVVYIHEAFKQPVILPTPPLTIDVPLIRSLCQYFEGGRCTEKSYISKNIGEEELYNLRDMGILKFGEGEVCMRKWVRKLMEVLKA